MTDDDKILLILDLDETLVHAVKTELNGVRVDFKISSS